MVKFVVTVAAVALALLDGVAADNIRRPFLNLNYQTIECDETGPFRIKKMGNRAIIRRRANANTTVWKSEMELPLGTMIRVRRRRVLLNGEKTTNRNIYLFSHKNCRVAKNTGPASGAATIRKIRNQLSSLVNKTTSWFTSLKKNNSNYQTIKCDERKSWRIKKMDNGRAIIEIPDDNTSVWKSEMELPLGTMIEIMGFEPVLLNETSNKTIYMLSHEDCWVTKNTGPEQGEAIIPKIRKIYSLLNKTISLFTSLKNNSNYKTIKCDETKPLRIKKMDNGTVTIKFRANGNTSVWKSEMEIPLGTMIQIDLYDPFLFKGDDANDKKIFRYSHGDCRLANNTGPEQGAATIPEIRNKIYSLLNKTTSWFTSLKKNNSNYQMEEDPEVEEPEVGTSIEPEVEEPEMEEDPEVEEPEVGTSIEPEVEEPEEPVDCYLSESEDDYYNCMNNMDMYYNY